MEARRGALQADTRAVPPLLMVLSGHASRPFERAVQELAILGIVPELSPFCRSGYLVGDREATWTSSSSEAPR
jgi:hypothetical protein